MDGDTLHTYHVDTSEKNYGEGYCQIYYHLIIPTTYTLEQMRKANPWTALEQISARASWKLGVFGSKNTAPFSRDRRRRNRIKKFKGDYNNSASNE